MGSFTDGMTSVPLTESFLKSKEKKETEIEMDLKTFFKYQKTAAKFVRDYPKQLKGSCDKLLKIGKVWKF